MSGTLATLRRELKAYFFSPLAYAILTLLLVINGIIFATIVSFIADPRYGGGRPLDFFFGSSWIVLLFVPPMLTMRLLAEERKSGSIEVLMTAPVTEVQVVVGKYLAALLFYAFLWAPTLAYAGIIAFYGELDWGTVAAGFVGLLAVGALFLAAGTLASALSRNQIVAAILTFVLLIVVFLVFGALGNLINDPLLKEVYNYLDASRQMDDFAKGIVDSRYLVYDFSMIVFFLFLASRALAAKKWR